MAIAVALATVCLLVSVGAYLVVVGPHLPRGGSHVSGAAEPQPAPAPGVPVGGRDQPPTPESATAAASSLSADYPALDERVDARIGVAWAPVGRPQQAEALGWWTSGPAWSTIKVPLSIALLRENDDESVTGAMRAAITASDNAAAQSIWNELGAHQSAAGKVEAVLAETGVNVVVPSEVTRPGFSAFGQTDWSLVDQARFLAQAACEPRDQPVLGLMGEIVSGQQWGLGRLEGAQFKGGWGPGVDGRYLVRQFGIIHGDSGDVAVAIAAVANSGGFDDGTTALGQVAGWLADHRADLPGGLCRTS